MTRPSNYLLPPLLLFHFLFALPTTVKADAEGDIPLPDSKWETRVEEREPGNPLQVADAAHEAVGSGVRAIARWVDSFFENPEYVDEATGRVTVGRTVERREGDDATYRTRVRGSVSLPNTTRALDLVFEGDEDSLEDIDGAQRREDIDPSSSERSNVGLQLTFLSTFDVDAKITTGARLSNRSIYIGPRLRLQRQLGERWLGRLIQNFRWYSDSGLRYEADLDFDRRAGKGGLFRQALSALWEEENFHAEGLRYRLTSSFTQPYGPHRAIRYAWSSDYYTRPYSGWRISTVSVSFRSALSRDWMIFSLTPFLEVEDENDWEVVGGVSLSGTLVFD